MSEMEDLARIHGYVMCYDSDKCKRLEAEVKRLREALEYAIQSASDGHECQFGNQDRCTVHDWQLKGECWVERAREALKGGKNETV